MISPTQKRLLASFRDLTPAQARLIKELCAARDNWGALITLLDAECPLTAAYVRECGAYIQCHSHWRTTFVLHAIDHILDTHGVEPLNEGETQAGNGYAPRYEFLNAGDTYATTLVYDRNSDRLFIGCWGDIAEKFATND